MLIKVKKYGLQPLYYGQRSVPEGEKRECGLIITHFIHFKLFCLTYHLMGHRYNRYHWTIRGLPGALIIIFNHHINKQASSGPARA